MGCHRAGGIFTASLDCSDCMAIELWWTYGFIIFAIQRMSLQHSSQPFITCRTAFTVRYSFFAHDNLVHDFTACSMVFNSYVLIRNYADASFEILSSGKIASASAWLPLLYDTYVFGLTLNRTLPSIRNKEAGHIIRTLFADGLLYYRCANQALRIACLTKHTASSAP